MSISTLLSPNPLTIYCAGLNTNPNSPIVFFNGRQNQYSFTGITTVGATNSTLLLFTTSLNQAYTFELYAEGFETVGTIGDTISINSAYRAKNVAGTATVPAGSLYNSASSDASISAATVTLSVSAPGVIRVAANGVAATTITWSGIINVYN